MKVSNNKCSNIFMSYWRSNFCRRKNQKVQKLMSMLDSLDNYINCSKLVYLQWYPLKWLLFSLSQGHLL